MNDQWPLFVNTISLRRRLLLGLLLLLEKSNGVQTMEDSRRAACKGTNLEGQIFNVRKQNLMCHFIFHSVTHSTILVTTVYVPLDA